MHQCCPKPVNTLQCVKLAELPFNEPVGPLSVYLDTFMNFCHFALLLSRFRLSTFWVFQWVCLWTDVVVSFPDVCVCVCVFALFWTVGLQNELKPPRGRLWTSTQNVLLRSRKPHQIWARSLSLSTGTTQRSCCWESQLSVSSASVSRVVVQSNPEGET